MGQSLEAFMDEPNIPKSANGDNAWGPSLGDDSWSDLEMPPSEEVNWKEAGTKTTGVVPTPVKTKSILRTGKTNEVNYWGPTVSLPGFNAAIWTKKSNSLTFEKLRNDISKRESMIDRPVLRTEPQSPVESWGPTLSIQTPITPVKLGFSIKKNTTSKGNVANQWKPGEMKRNFNQHQNYNVFNGPAPNANQLSQNQMYQNQPSGDIIRNQNQGSNGPSNSYSSDVLKSLWSQNQIHSNHNSNIDISQNNVRGSIGEQKQLYIVADQNPNVNAHLNGIDPNMLRSLLNQNVLNPQHDDITYNPENSLHRQKNPWTNQMVQNINTNNYIEPKTDPGLIRSPWAQHEINSNQNFFMNRPLNVPIESRIPENYNQINLNQNHHYNGPPYNPEETRIQMNQNQINTVPNPNSNIGVLNGSNVPKSSWIQNQMFNDQSLNLKSLQNFPQIQWHQHQMNIHKIPQFEMPLNRPNSLPNQNIINNNQNPINNGQMKNLLEIMRNQRNLETSNSRGWVSYRPHMETPGEEKGKKADFEVIRAVPLASERLSQNLRQSFTEPAKIQYAMNFSPPNAPRLKPNGLLNGLPADLRESLNLSPKTPNAKIRSLNNLTQIIGFMNNKRTQNMGQKTEVYSPLHFPSQRLGPGLEEKSVTSNENETNSTVSNGTLHLPGFSGENWFPDIPKPTTLTTTPSTTEKGSKVALGLPGGPQIIPDMGPLQSIHMEFTTFLTEITAAVSRLEPSKAKELFEQFEPTFTLILDSESFSSYGKIIIDAVIGLVRFVNTGPTDLIQLKIARASHKLQNRFLLLSEDLNSFFTFVDGLSTDEEKREMQEIAEDFKAYPNVSYSPRKLLDVSIEKVVLTPLKRLAGTSELLILTESLNRILKNREDEANPVVDENRPYRRYGHRHGHVHHGHRKKETKTTKTDWFVNSNDVAHKVNSDTPPTKPHRIRNDKRYNIKSHTNCIIANKAARNREESEEIIRRNKRVLESERREERKHKKKSEVKVLNLRDPKVRGVVKDLLRRVLSRRRERKRTAFSIVNDSGDDVEEKLKRNLNKALEHNVSSKFKKGPIRLNFDNRKTGKIGLTNFSESPRDSLEGIFKRKLRLGLQKRN